MVIILYIFDDNKVQIKEEIGDGVSEYLICRGIKRESRKCQRITNIITVAFTDDELNMLDSSVTSTGWFDVSVAPVNNIMIWIWGRDLGYQVQTDGRSLRLFSLRKDYISLPPRAGVLAPRSKAFVNESYSRSFIETSLSDRKQWRLGLHISSTATGGDLSKRVAHFVSSVYIFAICMIATDSSLR